MREAIEKGFRPSLPVIHLLLRSIDLLEPSRQEGRIFAVPLFDHGALSEDLVKRRRHTITTESHTDDLVGNFSAVNGPGKLLVRPSVAGTFNVSERRLLHSAGVVKSFADIQIFLLHKISQIIPTIFYAHLMVSHNFWCRFASRYNK